MKKDVLKRIIIWILLCGAFSVSGLLIIIFALGYKVSWNHFRLEKTGLIYIDANPSQLTVELNDKIIASNVPVKIPNLLPNQYKIILSSPDFQPWENNIDIEPGKAYVNTDIMLFLKNVIVQPTQTNDVSSFANYLPPDDILINNSEIKIIQDKDINLVTRLSQDVKVAQWYPGKKYLAYQVDKEIKIIDITGEQVVSLIKLDSDAPSQILFREGGKIILVKQNDKIIRAQIR